VTDFLATVCTILKIDYKRHNRAPGVERRTYPGLRHELHNEPEGPEVVDAIVAWLQQRTAGEPKGLAGGSGGTSGA